MRPFRFFFAVSLGVIIFFFLARVVVLALLLAAGLSVLFYAGRKIKCFFQRLDWDEGYDDYDHYAYQSHQLPSWNELSWIEFQEHKRERSPIYRTIEIQ